MKVAFVFDTVLLRDGNDYYGMTLTYNFFKERYLDKIDEMVIVTREADRSKHADESRGYEKTNGDNVEVSPVRSYSSIPDAIVNRSRIENELEEKLSKVDKVIIRMPSVLGGFAAKICQKLHKSYLIESVACAWDGYRTNSNPVGKIIAAPMYVVCRWTIKKAPFVLYVTNSFLQRRYPTNGKSYACSDVVLPEKNHRKNSYYSPSSGTPLRLCTVANVGLEYKGHKYVFRAIKKLAKKNINTEYILIGNGNPDNLKKIARKYKITNQVKFKGSLSHSDVMKELQLIDLYVQPSLTEGMPRALIEAMSVGCPVIASSVGGIPEIVDKDYLFKKKSASGIEKKIQNLLKQDALKQNRNRSIRISDIFKKRTLDIKRNEIYEEFLCK